MIDDELARLHEELVTIQNERDEARREALEARAEILRLFDIIETHFIQYYESVWEDYGPIPPSLLARAQQEDTVCDQCGGGGIAVIPDHSPSCNEFKCASDCPIPTRVECDKCKGRGYYPTELR